MIDFNTIISSFNERGTLLKWLKAVEKALEESVLESFNCVQIDETHIKFTLTFEDGSTYESNEILIPENIGVKSAYIDENNHLIIILQNDEEIDAGEVSLDNFYTKAETDNLLSAKADSDDVYNKTETDNLLLSKANSDDVYTKTETDNLLSAISNDVYTKTQTDNLLNAKQNFYEWVDCQNIDITSTPVTSLTNIDISQFIENYDENAEYEIIINILLAKNGDELIYIGSDIITSFISNQTETGTIQFSRNTFIIPIKKYLKYYLTSLTQRFFNIKLVGYRRIK